MKSRKPIDFSKVIAFTDLHLGAGNNNKRHNEWCESFVKWCIERAEHHGIKTLLFLGDWSHHRNSVNISTLNYSYRCLRMLNSYFDNVIMILGNHDLYFRDKLDVHSIPYAAEFANIHVLDKITRWDDFCFVPWLVGDEWKQISKIRQPYVFCHAEIARFKLNSMIEMPDHGGLRAEHFEHQKLVFSGHFHKRQHKDHILYIGNAFPHNFSDAGDDDRGIMVWTPGQQPQFEAWPAAPKYRYLTLSQTLLNPLAHIDNRTFAKVTVDANISYEEAAFVRELFESQLRALDVSFVNQADDGEDYDVDDAEVSFESVDSIVIGHLKNIQSTTMDINTLISIYQSI